MLQISPHLYYLLLLCLQFVNINIFIVPLPYFLFLRKPFLHKISLVSQTSLLQTLPQYHTKGLLKIHWSINTPNTPWYIPNGIVYENTWGKKTTYDVGFSFSTAYRLSNYYEMAGFIGASYYFRRAKNNYTFNGFFLRTGLVYSTYRTPNDNYKEEVYGIITDFGYQLPIYRKWHLELSYATAWGRFAQTSSYLPSMNRDNWDAFKWNDMAIRLGYRLF